MANANMANNAAPNKNRDETRIVSPIVPNGEDDFSGCTEGPGILASNTRVLELHKNAAELEKINQQNARIKKNTGLTEQKFKDLYRQGQNG